MNICGRIIEVRSSELRSGKKEIIGCITELFDVTQERMEKRRREEFVAKMTHDLKSPLMVLQGYLQAIRLGIMGDIDQKLLRTLDDMERSGKSLHSMIEDLLDVYRLEMGLVQIRRQGCDIRSLLENCCRDRQLDAEEQNCVVSLRVPVALPTLDLDGKQLSRVFANLIGNAIKFSPYGGRVTVTALTRKGNLRISVRDTGIGINEKDLPRIFLKYFRAEQAAGFKGSGLGLALSKEIVEAHGGAIEVESVEGKGSTFTVIIPLQE
jgi:signal transduction histidine kinase